MEIGHELQCDLISDIVWRNCRIIGVHDYGSAFSIRNCDRAVVSNVYNDIYRCTNGNLIKKITKTK